MILTILYYVYVTSVIICLLGFITIPKCDRTNVAVLILWIVASFSPVLNTFTSIPISLKLFKIMNKKVNVNDERHSIQPFIDWLVDNNKVTDELFDYMEEYLEELLAARKRVEYINSLD